MRHMVPAALLAVLLLFVPVYSESSDADESLVKTIYDSLDSDQKKAYRDLDTAVRSYSSLTGLEYLSIDEGEEVYYAYMYDHPEIFWFGDSYTIMVKNIEGTMSSFTYNEIYTPQEITKMRVAIANSLKSLDVDTGERDYRQLRTIHDWLCDRIEYTEGDHQGDIYGALVLGECVCEGYSTAFSYICHLYGYDCVVIIGYTYASDTIPHAWNLVYGEGDWYFVDVTWDDTSSSPSHNYFMVGSKTKVDGYVFATENHVADSLYGIMPADDRFYPIEDLIKVVIAAAIIGAVIIILYIYFRRRRKQNASPIVIEPEDIEMTFVGSYCSECGAPLGEEYSFCPSCGAKVPEKQTEEIPETDIQEEPPKSD